MKKIIFLITFLCFGVHIQAQEQAQAQWMQVELQTEGFKPITTGWIRWQQGGRLQIIYNLFS